MSSTDSASAVYCIDEASAEAAFAPIVLAFVTDPAARWSWPQADDFLRNMPLLARAFGGKSFGLGTAFGIDRFAGAALWLPPGETADEEALSDLIERTAPASVQRDAARVFEQMASFHPQEPHWYLPLIGVDPARQGQHLGDRLMAHALARCDADGLPAYLESSNPRNISFYQRHGFVELGKIQAGSSPTIVPMLRRPHEWCDERGRAAWQRGRTRNPRKLPQRSQSTRRAQRLGVGDLSAPRLQNRRNVASGFTAESFTGAIMHDVYCFGHVSTGSIVRLKGRFPAADGYAEIAETLENHAGEATGSALVLARLGVSVALEGNWIGDTPACRRTLEFLQSRGIDCSGLVVKPGYPGVNEIVISDGETRTVFGRYVDLLFTTPQWEPPNLDRVRAAKLVCVDPAFGETTLAVARAARGAGRLLVTCDARHDSPLAALADIHAVSGELIAREYPDAWRSEAARAALFDEYVARAPGLVVFTAGSRPAWFARRGEPRHEMAPLAVTVVDSAGAGDAFRGGLIFGSLRQWTDEQCVRFASAVAALVCTTAPGCVHAPMLDQVTALLEERQISVPLP